jgi:hypothetical protein
VTAPVQQLASRVRKARAQSVCGLCTAIIRVGSSIGRVPGSGWCHCSCIVERNRQAHAGQAGQ